MNRSLRTKLFGVTSSLALVAPSALAQAPVHRHVGQRTGLTEIVVTAQKRSQRLQDVPIAITAVTQATLQANRITSASDLNGVAPNVSVRQSGGSIGIPSFTIRGIVSYGVVPGSDKETSIYIDGVYLGAPSGSDFELPDIRQIEILRGPQGTLFGRNATTGAVSITTRDPDGVLGGRQEFSVGNYDEFRTRTSVNLPAVGPFSGYVSFVHDEHNGDIRNVGAGQVWDRSGPNTGQDKIEVSPKTLGAKDSNSYFVALKYEPTDWLKNVYKFDYGENHYTPEGVATTAVYPPGLGGLGTYLDAVLAANAGDYTLNPSARRPDAVNNAYSTTDYEKNYGHNLTTTAQVNDAISLKNILAYRYSFIYTNDQLDGLGGLKLPTYLGGTGANDPFCVLCISSESSSRQFSDELQGIYTSHFLTLTTGLLYFHENTQSAAPPGEANNFVLQDFPGGRIPLGLFYPPYAAIFPAYLKPFLITGGWATSYNSATSLAAYTQAELHITNQLDLVGGLRLTDDKKSGTFVYGGDFTPGANNNYTTGSFSNLQYANFRYQNTKPAYSVSVNYKPTHDILVYGKYSDSFVSGGAIGGVPFKPETASSLEVGGKADFLNHRLRANVALFDVEYRNLQSAQSGLNVGYPQLGTVIVDQGDANAKGFELETNAKPIDAVTLSGSIGYTDVYYSGITNAIKAAYGNSFAPLFVPKWTADVSGAWESEPMWRGSKVIARIDANWESKERTGLTNTANVPGFAAQEFVPAYWNVNVRLSLGDIDIGGHTFEIAGWARNLTQNRLPVFPLNFGSFSSSTTFLPARTYGMDVSFQF